MSNLGHVLVLGLGSSGEATARYLVSLPEGAVESVTVADAADNETLRAKAADLSENGIEVLLGVEALSSRFDLCVASPGIPPHAPLMASAKHSCDEVISEIEFAYRRSGGRWVAVTGTNGKTTTTALVAHLLETGGFTTRLVGNIGTPAISVVDAAGPQDVFVAEVSSFQLALTTTFRPKVAVLLNITPDHIDWHGSFDRYASDKVKMFANQAAGDTAVIDVDDSGSAPYAAVLGKRGVDVWRVSVTGAPAQAGLSDGVLWLDAGADPGPLVAVSQLHIRGAHNTGNALAAAAAAAAMGVSRQDISRGLTGFQPIEHRLEPFATVRGVQWFNDSKATNPDAVVKAIAAFDDRKIVLLLGGRNKGNSFDSLARTARGRVRAVVAFGEARDEIARAFARASFDPVMAPDLEHAVTAAARLAQPGDAAVLSPACASFDEFDGYEHRGRIFKEIVQTLEERL